MNKQESQLAKLATEYHRDTMERHGRFMRAVEALDRNTLAERYAMALVLLQNAEAGAQFEQQLSEHQGRAVELAEAVARDATRAVVKAELDRKRGAAAMLAKNPKQAAKKEAFKEWQDWQAGRAIHKNQSQFAQYIVKKFPTLESPKQVASWATKWRREAHPTK